MQTLAPGRTAFIAEGEQVAAAIASWRELLLSLSRDRDYWCRRFTHRWPRPDGVARLLAFNGHGPVAVSAHPDEVIPKGMEVARRSLVDPGTGLPGFGWEPTHGSGLGERVLREWTRLAPPSWAYLASRDLGLPEWVAASDGSCGEETHRVTVEGDAVIAEWDGRISADDIRAALADSGGSELWKVAP